MTEQEEFEFRLRLEKERAQPAEKKPNLPPVMRTMGNLAAGAIRGAGSIGATLLTPYDYLSGNTQSIGNPERRADMDNALAMLGFDTDSFAFGAGKFGAEIAGTAGIPIARTGGWLAKTGKSALSAGASAGLVNPEDAPTGALIGGVLTPASALGAKVGQAAGNRIVNPLLDLVRPEGHKNILGRYIRNTVGEANVPTTINAAKASVAQKIGPELYDVPRYPTTVAEAMAGVPEGSPLSRLQELTAMTKGGPSAKFGKIAQARESVLVGAEQLRDTLAAPARQVALDAAKVGGVRTEDIVDQIDILASSEGYRASDMVTKTLSEVRNKIMALAPQGQINPADLYTVRKEIGSTIGKFSKETANWDKGLTAKLEKSIQQSIDDAIEKAGGTGWKDYLREYAGRSKAIDTARKRAEEMYRPAQKTNLGGGVNIAEETREHIPNLLSRAAMASNFVLRTLGKRLEPRIDELAAEVFSNPQAYADLMARTPPQMRFQLDKALRAANALAVYQAE